jgi:hypothetical protein
MVYLIKYFMHYICIAFQIRLFKSYSKISSQNATNFVKCNELELAANTNYKSYYKRALLLIRCVTYRKVLCSGKHESRYFN